MMPKSRFLILDHFFDQDICELVENLNSSAQISVIPATRWRAIAVKVFPEKAFDGLSSAFLPECDSNWITFHNLVEKEVEWIMACYRPTLFVVPSDTYFYIRPFITEFEKYGVSTFVVQKETTISPYTMAEHSLELGKYCPFMSVHMTVCSQRHKDFWVRCGANPAQITVTGQPRFDYYHRKSKTKVAQDQPKLLYLSFDDKAYIPENTSFTWESFRQDVESVIAENSDRWDVTVKRHPQQTDSHDWLGKNVTRADRLADTRDLISGSDLIIGFQTTAVYEAVLAGRPVIYCAWGVEYDFLKELLIRFDLDVGMTTFVNSRLELESLLSEGAARFGFSSKSGLLTAEQHLGVFDGQASQRVFDVMSEYERVPVIPRLEKVLGRLLSSIVKIAFLFLISCFLYLTKGRLYRSARRRLYPYVTDVRNLFS